MKIIPQLRPTVTVIKLWSQKRELKKGKGQNDGQKKERMRMTVKKRWRKDHRLRERLGKGQKQRD